MLANRGVILILVAVVSSLSLFVFIASGNPKNGGIERLTEADLKEFLLLPYIDASAYNSTIVQLPALDNLVGIGDFAVISTAEQRSGSLPATSIDFGVTHIATEERADLKWLSSMFVCSPDLSVFVISISKPKSFNEATAHIYQRAGYGFANPSSGIPSTCNPRIESGQYSLVREYDSRIGLTRFSVEMGLVIGVDFMLQDPMQPPGIQYNRDALLAQMNVLIDQLIAFIDGDIKMTEEKEAYYKEIIAAYRKVVPEPEVIKADPDDNKWWEDPDL
jgi:hypothetical protein